MESLELRTEGETVWASQADIEVLFGVDQSGVSRHMGNIFRTAEVDPESNMQKVHIAGVTRPVTLYSLDVVLAVGAARTRRAAVKHACLGRVVRPSTGQSPMIEA